MSIRKQKKPKIVARVPAKLGSTRLRMKNLALMVGKPLIYYAIKAAKESRIFDSIAINAEDAIFSKIARRYRVNFYKRPDSLVRPDAKTDEVVYDFFKKNICDIVAWVSPIAPLQTGREVRDIVKYFMKENLDSLMTVKNEQVHCAYNGNPVNFRPDEMFAKTQDLRPLQVFVYSVMMWRAKIFMRTFKRKGHALFCGKVGFYPIDKLSSVIIKNKDDIMMAESLHGAINKKKSYKVKYDKLATRFYYNQNQK